MAFRLLAKQLTQQQQQRQLLRYFSSVIKLEMPALSPTMSEGNIISWNKKEGDRVKVGDLICEIQTDKATIGFESQEDGYLAKIIVPGESKGVEVGKLIGLLVEEPEEIKGLDVSKYISQANAAAPKKEEPKKETSPAQKQEVNAAVGVHDFENEYHNESKKFKIAPSAGFYLKTFQVLPSEVKASGPKNYI